jgi:hypothetical protein
MELLPLYAHQLQLFGPTQMIHGKFLRGNVKCRYLMILYRFVSFNTEADARAAVEYTRHRTFQGKPLRARLKTESLSKPVL